jgi:hypothetical protein
MVRALKVFSLVVVLIVMVPAVTLADSQVASSPGGTALRAPANVRATSRPQDAGIRIALTWDGAEGAFGYNVYRADTPDGPLAQVGGKAADSMLDYPVFLDDDVEPGRGYYYAVSSVDEELNESPMSARTYAFLEAAAKAAAGPKKIVCSLSDQRLYFFEGDQLVNVTRCSTGLNNRTPTGNFRILGHYGTNVGLGGAVCDYWMSFTSAHGMHAWPRGSRTYETGLGAPASHGCIRQHPMEAYWPYFWAPNGTPLTVTYASLARRVIKGCHSSIGAPEPSVKWYFAEGFTSMGYDTFLLLSNPGEGGVEAKVSFNKDSGEVVEQTVGIMPHSRYTISVDSVPGMDAATFAMQVSASGPVVAERAIYFSDGGLTDGTVSLGITEPSPDWYFAEGFTAESFNTFLLLYNPGDTAVNARLDFHVENGGTYEHGVRIEPHSRYTVSADAIPAVSAASFSTEVHADGPIVAERAMYFTMGYITGGHASMGAAEPSTTWYFSEGCTRQFFQSYILICNPGDLDTVVGIDYYLNDASVRYEYLVRARGRLTIPISLQGGLSNTEMAFTVTSGYPVVVERSVYYDLDSHRGGTCTMGSPQTSPTWFFAEGFTDGAFDTFIMLSNPSSTPANVVVIWGREDGTVLSIGYVISPQRRVTIAVDNVPGLERASFSTIVSSDVPIMAERTMYFVMPRGY